MSLFQQLSRYGNETPLVGSKTAYSVKDLEYIKHCNSEALIKLKGKKVVFRELESIDIAACLIILSDVVHSLLILPSNVGNDVGDELEKGADIQYRVYLKRGKLEYLELSTNPDKVYEVTEGGLSWLVPTSGTSGVPKLVKHSLSSLVSSVKVNRCESRKYVWGACYEIGRFAGIQVFLQALYSGSQLTIYDDFTDISSLVAFYVEQGVTSLSATPSFWRKIISSPASSSLTLTSLTLGGEIVDQTVLNALSNLYPNSQIRHIYASTEAGVGFVVSDKKEGFPASYLNEGFGAVDMKISPDSTLMLRNRGSSQSYIGNKELCDRDGFIDSGDIVELKGERVLFKGRASGVINVGGNKVHPETVESVISQLNEVILCRVYSKKNPILGNVVAADVLTNEPKEAQKELKFKLIELCKTKLEPYQVPHIVKFVGEIKVSENGKILRR